MEEIYLLNMEGVKKKILHGGYGALPDFQEGSKITFHFQTLKDNFERTVIEDSRRSGLPMEIIVGKMFKIEVWETLLTSMHIGEVAEFWCDAGHTGMYALASKGWREVAEGKDPLQGQKHRCGLGNMFDYHSTGYGDLDELQRTPQALIFIMELFKVEDPFSYRRDTWAMNDEEKLAAVPQLHTEGNRLVLSRKFKQAAEKYQEAVICLCDVQVKEKPREEGWLKLENLITSLVLNYCQCQLELGEYYEVLEHTTAILQKNNENVKAYFKRGKAHAAVWNEKEARADFLKVAQLDPSLAAAVRKELKLLGERMRPKQMEDRKRYRDLFRQPISKRETRARRAEVKEASSVDKEEPAGAGGGLMTEKEEDRPEALVDKRGLGPKDRESGQGNVGGRLRGKERERKKETFVPQKKTEEMVTARERRTPEDQRLCLNSGDDLRENKEQPGLGLREPKVETEAAEVSSRIQDQNGKVSFAPLREKQLSITSIQGCLRGVAVNPMNDTEEGSTEGHRETEMRTEGEIFIREGELEGKCENRETEAHSFPRDWANMDFGTENCKEGGGANSFDEEDYLQVQQELSKRGMEVLTGLNLMEEMALMKEKRCTDKDLKPEEKLCGYSSSPACCEANPEGRVAAVEECGKGMTKDSVKTERSLREERGNHKEKAGCDNEGTNTEDTSTTQEEFQGDEIRTRCFEAELLPGFETQNSKMESDRPMFDTEQVHLQISWEDTETRGGSELISAAEMLWGSKEMSGLESGDLRDMAVSIHPAEDRSQAFGLGEMAGSGAAEEQPMSASNQTALMQEEPGQDIK